ncbi:MAG TPA: STAS domain-containing protein [Chondromyces sp.]|nr:STAS domain-containing protein [Chondromyces sp.]
MKDELKYIGEKIIKNDRTLAGNLENPSMVTYTKKSTGLTVDVSERVEFNAELIRYFGRALFEDRNSLIEKVADWAKRAATLNIENNVSLTDSLRAMSNFRTVIWGVFTEELEQRQFAPITMLDVSIIIDPLLDKASSVIGEVYEKHNSELMKIAYTALEELSVPVVPISKEIAVIPIVGEIDTHRAKLVMEVSLFEGTRLNLKYIILDVSGVLMIDTMVADQLFKIIESLRLTGIRTIITGIRPEIAQTIVSLGLNFDSVMTRANMQQALSELGFKQVGKLEGDKN